MNSLTDSEQDDIWQPVVIVQNKIENSIVYEESILIIPENITR